MARETKKKLTKTQQEGLEIFKSLREELLAKGYKETSVFISALKANIITAIIAIPIYITLAALYIFIHGWASPESTATNLWVFVTFLICVVIHELLHGIGWARAAQAGWQAIRFGIIWRYLNPYCTCREALPYREYALGAILPTIILGVIPYIIALITGSGFLLVLSLLNTLVGGADIYLVFSLRKYKDHLLIDHPYLIGCVAFKRA